MSATRAVIGVDVGGTNTDAVIVDKSCERLKIIGKTKTSTTSDVTTGISRAIHLALINFRNETGGSLIVQQINIGTTHFINAVIEGKSLAKVAVIRLCGTASTKLPPFSDFAKHLLETVRGSVFMVSGGYQFDGSEIVPLDEEEIIECAKTLKSNGESNIVISGIFSPVRQQQEQRVVEIIRSVYPEASVTASHEIGRIGLLERENAAILNESIKPLCRKTITGFRAALDNLGLQCPMYLTQNDGTILSEEKALQFPVLSFASGATNSMRGAAALSGLKDAIVVDIGGTSTDVGILLKGFPREASSQVKIGVIRTNFRMPDVISIGLGGGSFVDQYAGVNGKQTLKVGPQSAGYRLTSEALVFEEGKSDERRVTATDIAVADGLADVGDKERVAHLDKEFVNEAVYKIHDMVASCIDQMRFNDRDLPLVLVGGGSILLDKTRKFDGVSEIIIEDHFDVANAVGAALSQVSANTDQVIDLEKEIDRVTMETDIAAECKLKNATTEEDKQRLTEAVKKEYHIASRQKAIDKLQAAVTEELIASGAISESIQLVDKEDVALAYVPGNATRIKIKLVGDLKFEETGEELVVPESVFTSLPVTGSQSEKQTISATGVILTEINQVASYSDIRKPTIDESTGEWILSSYDIDCISIGAGIMGCGGGGNPHIGRILALQALEAGKKIRVAAPSRFLKNADAENDLVSLVAFMGAPLIFYEKLVNGKETISALQCLQDLYKSGGYDAKEGCLTVEQDEGVVKEAEGIRYIDDFKIQSSGDQTSAGTNEMGKKKIVAIMSAEIGGMNCIEPLLVGAELDLPVLDCDGMGRAFPELQMFSPFIYGCKPYPSTIADDKGRRAALLYVDGPKHLENHFRDVVISMGCSAGIVLSHFNKEEVLSSTVPHSLSHAWRIGDAVMRARAGNQNPVDAVVKLTHGLFVIYGKITDLLRETTGGFNKGKAIIKGLDTFDGQSVTIEFQNEFILCREEVSSTGESRVRVCVPDLITMMDAETAQPIPTEELRYGMRVAVVGMRVHPLMTSEQALKYVGPQCFGLGEGVKYVPLNDFTDLGPICPL